MSNIADTYSNNVKDITLLQGSINRAAQSNPDVQTIVWDYLMSQLGSDHVNLSKQGRQFFSFGVNSSSTGVSSKFVVH